MPRYLLIVESPAKAKTMKKYLGADWKIAASMGHIRDLPQSHLGVDVKGNFEPMYITVQGKNALIRSLKEDAQGMDQVYLATDPDREGEAISWHLAKILGIPEDSKTRVTFNEITETAVKKAVANPRSLDMNLVDAQQARRILDRIVGYELSPILWKKVRKGLSAGRVQSVATRIICDREDEIEAFIPVEYWSLDTLLEKATKEQFIARFYGIDGKKTDLNDEPQVQNILQALKNTSFLVKKVKKSKRRRSPAPPFITSTLQQDASRKFGYGAQRTMIIAQQLYEGVEIEGEGAVGLITYMRTDSVRISEDALTEARAYIEETFGKDYMPKEARQFKTKSAAQDAHEAIRPSYIRKTPESLSGSLTPEQEKLYGLIWERFMASQMEPAVYDTLSIDIETSATIAESFIMSEPTTMDVAASHEAKEALVQDGNEEETIANNESLSKDSSNGKAATVASSAKANKAMPMYHTYNFRASGSTLVFKGFMALYIEGTDDEVEEKDQAMPVLKEGEKLSCSKLLPEQHFTQPPPRYTEASLVKDMEENGIGRPSTYAPTIGTILSRGYVDRDQKKLIPTELGRIVNKMMCENFDQIVNVHFTADMEHKLDTVEEGAIAWRDLLQEFYTPFKETLKKAEESIVKVVIPVEESDEICEKCGKRMVIRTGRYGRFLACPGFPECKNTKPFAEDAGVKCPLCGGRVVHRKTKKNRKYIGCEKYPDCTFVSWAMPGGKDCPECGNFMTAKKKGGITTLTCSSPTCEHTE